MATDPNEQTTRLVASIADSKRIDWDEMRRESSLSESELSALRALETIRQLQAGEESQGPSAGTETSESTEGAAPAEPAPPLETGFENLTPIGRGRFGTVYRATDRALGREVALKVMNADTSVSAESRARFVREARVVASLNHPNIVRIFQVDDREGTLRIVLEHIQGATLDRWIRDNGVLAPEEAARVAIDLCRALAALHGKHLVHQDLTPANVMRETGGRIVLLDFGFTRSAIPGSEGELGGTPYYMAPEQFTDGQRIGPRADLYALGSLLYFLATGKVPFEASSFLELREKKLQGAPTPIADRRPDVPRGFAAIVERAIATRAEDRYQSAGEFEQALRGFLAGAVSEPRPSGRSLRVNLAFAAILAVALGAALWGWIASRSRAPFVLETQLFASRDGNVRLGRQDAVHPGDNLFLEVKPSEPLYVYVFNADDAGETNLLFPLPGYDLKNPLPGGATHRLPGPKKGNAGQTWTVTSAGGGAETFIIVAGKEPVEKAEELLKEIPPAQEDRPVVLTREQRDAVLRGVGGVSKVPLPAATSGQSSERKKLDELMGKLEAEPVWDGATMVRTLRVRNTP